MIAAIIITVIITSLVCCVIYLATRKTPPKIFFIEKQPEPKQDWEGRPVTRLQQLKIDRQMKAFLERNPNHSFWKDHPEYLEKYLGDIDLSELDESLK